MSEEERVMEYLRQYFEECRDPSALSLALHYVQRHQYQFPEWLMTEVQAILRAILKEKHAKRPGRGQRSLEEKKHQREADFVRFHTVENLRKKGVPRLAVWQAASDELADSELFSQFAGAAESIQRSYYTYQRFVESYEKGESVT